MHVKVVLHSAERAESIDLWCYFGGSCYFQGVEHDWEGLQPWTEREALLPLVSWHVGNLPARVLLLERSTQPWGSVSVFQWDRTFDFLVLKTVKLTLGVFCQPSGIHGGTSELLLPILSVTLTT